MAEEQSFRIVPLGDSAVTVEFEQEISQRVNAKVMGLFRLVEEAPFSGYRESVPAYRSLTVHYDPLQISYEEIAGILAEACRNVRTEEDEKALTLTLPVCYGGEFGPDLPEVAAFEGISAEEVVRRHSEGLSFVYFIGFAPGNAYIGAPAETFHVPRKKTPRLKIPAGSITIWQSQTTVFPMEQPGGWNVIGRTPLTIFDAKAEDPFLIKAGMKIHFVPVSEEEYRRIAAEVAAGTYRVKLTREEEADR